MIVMSLPMENEEWDRIGVHIDDASLMTPLGLVEGEVLDYVEEKGSSMLVSVIRDLAWPAPVVVMAVGALVREGLIRAKKRDQGIELESLSVLV